MMQNFECHTQGDVKLMSEKKKVEISPKKKKYIRELLRGDLAKQDLKEWQKACTRFSPFDYSRTTRKAWFAENEEKIPTGKKIIKFIDTWAKTLRADENLEKIKMAALRDEIVEVVREAQSEQRIESGKLNTFKVATFRTLLKWDEDPSKLEEGPYEGRKALPAEKRKATKSRRGRKSQKKKYVPPMATLVKRIERKGTDEILLTIGLTNNILHPYQNVELELELGPNFKIKHVKPYSYDPKQNRIIIGFIEASLSPEPYETECMVTVTMAKPVNSFTISCVIYYDDTEKGQHAKVELEREKITL